MGRRGYQQQRRPAEHLEFELQQHRQRQPGAFGHRGAGRTYHHEAQGQQRRSADLPGLFPFRTGKHVLHALQPGNSRELPGHTLYGPRRNRPQPQVRTRNAPGGLRDDRQRHRSGHPPDRRHGLFGSEIPLQLQGRLLLRLALLPVHAGLGQCHQIRDDGPDLQPVVAAARLQCDRALPNGTSRHQEYVNSASTANFLLQAATSNSGLLFDWYSTAGRYSHGKLQGIYETVQPKKAVRGAAA